MTVHRTLIALGAVLALTGCAHMERDPIPDPLQAGRDCAADLDFAAAFLIENDAGIRALGWSAYPPAVQDAFARAQASAVGARSADACAEILNAFLRSIRRGHLAAFPLSALARPSAAAPRAPTVRTRRLSAQTSYIEVPLFDDAVRQELLRIIDADQDGIRTARKLIIDLRRNGGGNDSAAEPLLALLGPATYRVANPQVLVTDANRAAWEALLPQLSTESDRQLVKGLLAQMSTTAEPWLVMSDAPVSETRYGPADVRGDPERVVLMIDEGCASSCEQFILTARQNPRVSTAGRKTFGALDASNCRVTPAPSGTLGLYYATTYIWRPDGQQIDDIGITPDLVLPSPADPAAHAAEVTAVQNIIEQNGPADGTGRASSDPAPH